MSETKNHFGLYCKNRFLPTVLGRTVVSHIKHLLLCSTTELTKNTTQTTTRGTKKLSLCGCKSYESTIDSTLFTKLHLGASLTPKPRTRLPELTRCDNLRTIPRSTAAPPFSGTSLRQRGSTWQPTGKLLLTDRGSREQTSHLLWLVSFLPCPCIRNVNPHIPSLKGGRQEALS